MKCVVFVVCVCAYAQDGCGVMGDILEQSAVIIFLCVSLCVCRFVKHVKMEEQCTSITDQ